MATFILTWNPTNPAAWETYEEALADNETGKTVEDQWSVGRLGRPIQISDSFFLLRQGDPRGIIAAGTFLGTPYLGDHWDGSGRQAPYAQIRFETILPVDEVLPVEELQSRAPSFLWVGTRESGNQVRGDDETELHALWAEHLSALGMAPDWHSPEEAEAQSYPEGAVTTVLVSRYERNPHARDECIKAHGYDCAVCGFDFSQFYGALGNKYIHVHHLYPLSEGEQDVDPVKDMRPVCPNCHEMLHRSGRPDDIDGLRSLISR